MNYYKITLRVTDKVGFVKDILMSYLGDAGFESFEDTSLGFNAYIPENLYDKTTLHDIIKGTAENYDCEITYREEFVKERNWNAVWEQNSFEPIEVDDTLIIYPTSRKQDYQNGRFKYQIELNPVQAFGSGYHETTRMMLSYILEEKLDNKTFLDMGCGTAVLAILARKRNASPVAAIDIDHWSTENAIDNAKINDVSDIQVVLGDVSAIKTLRMEFDCIFANINRNILTQDIPLYVNSLANGGSLFVSGFYTEDMDIIRNAAEAVGLEYKSHKSEN
ncbi:MAG: 50S ribosomal protein L11 methyltransferase, partial [bacterium]|nr:50S ribosomal protein L11 methyltransferase [Candidatus Minthenecus merdequi]